MAKPINLEIKTDYGAEKLTNPMPESDCSYPTLMFDDQFFKLLKPHIGDLNPGDEVIIAEVTLRMKRKTEDLKGGSFCFDVLSFSGVEDASVAEKEEPEMDGTDDE